MFLKEFKLNDYRLNKIIERCEEKKIGARGLQAALDEYIVEKIFEEEIDLEDYTHD
jgi:ATP-dependent protease Clp ATPase subunit